VECPKCGKDLKVRTNRKTGSKFYGCPGYPKCKFTKKWTKPEVTAESCRSDKVRCFGCELGGTDQCHLMIAAFGEL